MARVHARSFHPWERTRLYRMKRQLRNLVNSRHARIVLLSRGGLCNRDIAQCADCTPQWVRTILHRFNAGGIEAIAYWPYFRAPYSRRSGVRHMFGLFDLETDRLYGVFARRKTWVQFLSFLKGVRRRSRPDETLHIVLDNYKPHLKAEVLTYAAAHRIRWYFTPTNASWLNRIECHFTALKKFALESSDFRSHQEQQEAIQSYLKWRNRRRKISRASWLSSRRQQLRPAA
jgi:transposase